MMRKLYPIAVLFVGLLFLAIFAADANAAMSIYGLQQRLSEYGIPITDPSEKYDRFYSGPDRDFIGEGYDWSGVGLVWRATAAGYYTRWVTMISPTYFLTATHTSLYTGYIGSEVTFYDDQGNPLGDPDDPYIVDGCVGTFGDLYIGRLNKPIAEEDNITYYPILDFDTPTGSTKSYNNLVIYAMGRGSDHPSDEATFNPRVARNRIDKINFNDSSGPSGSTDTMIYDYDAYDNDDPDRITSKGLGDDECRVEMGDSGAPSFAVCNGELVLVGIHQYIDIYPITDPDHDHFSADSFVPNYLDINEIPAAMNNDVYNINGETIEIMRPIPGDANMDGIVNDLDLAIWATNEGKVSVRDSTVGWIQGDFTGDGAVYQDDLEILIANWLETWDTYIPPTAVPEPAVFWLVLTGLASVIFLRRWRVR